jgi:hypothetical protein
MNAQQGLWRLEPGRVVRMTPREDRWLRAGNGTLWATLEPAPVSPYGAPDFILSPGERLRVRGGQTVVLSASSRRTSASYEWEPLPAPRRVAPGLTDWRLAALQVLAHIGFVAGMAS